MCGIAGVFSRTQYNISERFDIKSAVQSIEHRGPDQKGFLELDSCVLGMCRLAILDFKKGSQPLFSEDKQISLIFNGEIYNFRELRNELMSKGYRFFSNSDSEILIPLYIEFGIHFVTKLQGMFAIAIYDRKEKIGVLARDRLGKKPIWYKEENSQLLFASEVKGLLKLGINTNIAIGNIPEYLQYGYVNAPKSSYEGVKQLQPGHVLTFHSDKTLIQRYWEINQANQILDLERNPIASLRDLIIDAVSSRLVSDRPIGAFLSGGIDSSLITAIMSNQIGKRVNTYSIGFEDKRFNESIYAKAIANYLGTNHHELVIKPDPALVVNLLSKIVDIPFADSSIIPTYILSEFARNDVVVALGGDGGDEVFGGYLRYEAAIKLQRINFLLALVPGRALSKLIKRNPRIEKFLRSANFSKLSTRYQEMQSLITRTELGKIVSAELQSEIDNSDIDLIWRSISSQSTLAKLQQFDIATYLPGDLLFKADMATMANGLELRSPLLDYRVVEAGVSLPDKLKIHNGVNKIALRRILAEFIPIELFERPKQGFGIPRASWIRNELRSVVEETLGSHEFRNRGFFDSKEMMRVLKTHLEGKDLDRIIWPVFVFELWARNWIDPRN
jgi:asparagine synthase (glutamine-hydrolysing)